jgi:hypothetical protein
VNCTSRALVLLSALLLSLPVETHASPRSESVLPFRSTSEHFTVWYSRPDASVVLELLPLLENYHGAFQIDFGCGPLKRTTVEVYPDQASYDASIMNLSLRGSPAISGNGRVQLVSPRAQISQNWIPYGERLRFCVHELAHLYMNLIDPSMPEWMQEGTATLFGSPTMTGALLKEVVSRIPMPPTLDDVQSHYATTAAADLLSASLVGFVIEAYGIAAFRSMLRSGQLPIEPGQEARARLESAWTAYLRESTR